MFMVQWRKEDDEGRTYFLPYSKWSDGLWRIMEPDGLLPLYGLDELAKSLGASRVMVHQGAKCARNTQALVDSKASHPWMPDLDRFVHLGWPGGVNSADRVDWTPILKLGPHLPVVLVCDNDASGMDVASPISRILRRSLMAVKFNSKFPTGFDLADPWPRHQKWWRSNGQYCGPTLDELCSPATWATAAFPIKPGSSKFIFKIVEPFAKEWLWVEDLDVFINSRQLDRLLIRRVFDSRVSSFSDVEDTAKLLVKLFWPKCDGITYEPGEPSGVINEGSMRVVNTYRPGDILPVKGDPAPFKEFMRHLIPVEKDRNNTMRWMMALAARQDVRMRYGTPAPLRAAGGGQSALAQIMAWLVGLHNVSFPEDQDMVESNFSSWVPRKRLAIVNENLRRPEPKGIRQAEEQAHRGLHRGE